MKDRMDARAYLDWNASAPLSDAAREAMIEALGAANPSSVHREGREARRLAEKARRAVADLVNGKPEHVVFTSGATEAASMLLTPQWQMGRSDLCMSHLYVSEADHPCLLEAWGAANPSSVHREGREARRLAEKARRAVADLVNGKPEHVVFTSGATEAASMLLTPQWQMGRSDLCMSHLYVSEADHPCLL